MNIINDIREGDILTVPNEPGTWRIIEITGAACLDIEDWLLENESGERLTIDPCVYRAVRDASGNISLEYR